jgi:hypothetical protein
MNRRAFLAALAVTPLAAPALAAAPVNTTLPAGYAAKLRNPRIWGGPGPGDNAVPGDIWHHTGNGRTYLRTIETDAAGRRWGAWEQLPLTGRA